MLQYVSARNNTLWYIFYRVLNHSVSEELRKRNREIRAKIVQVKLIKAGDTIIVHVFNLSSKQPICIEINTNNDNEIH